MRMIIIAAAACLALAGCTTTEGTSPVEAVDTAIQDNLPALCEMGKTAHLAVQIAAASGTLSERIVRNEELAYGILEPLCVDPENATSASVLIAAVGAYSTIVLALREAEKQE